MRTLLLCILCAISVNALSQITWQNPNPTHASLNSIYYHDENLGWVAGDDGTIMKINSLISDDWVLYNSSISADLKKIEVDENGMGYCLGEEGILLKTTDWGESWDEINLSTTEDLFDVEIMLSNKVWVVGSEGVIYFSDDAGSNWEIQSTGTELDLRSICMINENEGWIAGENYCLFHTTNGGQDWSIEFLGTGFGFNTVYFINDMEGWAGGYLDGMNADGLLIKTIDGGLTWQELSDYPIQDIHFFDSINGWVQINRNFYRSIDGGESWFGSGYQWHNTFFMMDTIKGFSAGNFGSTSMTIDGFDTWEYTVNGITYQNLWRCSFVDEQHGWAGGEEGIILHTNNGGDDWSVQESSAYSPINGIFFTDSQNGWALSFYKLLKTTNGGELWEEVLDTTISFNDLFFLNPLKGWVVGHHTIFYTEDGGLNWSEQEPAYMFWGDLLSVFFLNDTVGWIASQNGCHRTTDGGEQWNFSTKGTRNTDVYFINEDKGWMTEFVSGLGSRLWRTENGGVSWTEICFMYDIYFKDIYFINDDEGYAPMGNVFPYEDDDGVFYTSDGGYTWSPVENSGRNMMGLSFINNETAWFVGLGGQIFKMELDPVSISSDINANKNENLLIYPLPCSSILNVKLRLDEESDISILLHTINGHKLIDNAYGKHNEGLQTFSISTESLPAGMYFITIMTNQTKVTQKVIKH